MTGRHPIMIKAHTHPENCLCALPHLEIGSLFHIAEGEPDGCEAGMRCCVDDVALNVCMQMRERGEGKGKEVLGRGYWGRGNIRSVYDFGTKMLGRPTGTLPRGRQCIVLPLTDMADRVP